MTLMKLSRKIFEVGLLIFGLIILWIYIFNSTRENQNILENMKDGMCNESILMYYQEEIDEVKSMTNGTITIMHYDVDLNGDNYTDRIVSIISPLHSGVRGDTLEILLNDGKTYTRMQNSFCIRLYKQDSEKTPVSVINILESKTNGFCDIRIVTDENNCVLRYKDGNYQVDSEVEETFDTYKEERLGGVAIPIYEFRDFMEEIINFEGSTEQERRIEQGERTILYGTYSTHGIAIEDSEPGMFRNYEELIAILSDAFIEGTIEEILQEMEYRIEPLSPDETQHLIKNETYGRLEAVVNEPEFGREQTIYWYLLEQTDTRSDVILQKKYNDGIITYITFKCDVNEKGKLCAALGLHAYANTDEHLFIEYKGLKYLCNPKRNEVGEIYGIAIHIYELENHFGSDLYIEYGDEVKVTTYTIIDGSIGDPYPDYLEE